jgi:rubrerythrin
MPEINSLNILKSAILLEIRGKDFYEKAADSAGNQVVRDFFQKMANDESAHIQILSDQYKAY